VDWLATVKPGMAITIAKSVASAIRLRFFISMFLLVIERFDNEFLGESDGR
jgi:hypothetical protein